MFRFPSPPLSWKWESVARAKKKKKKKKKNQTENKETSFRLFDGLVSLKVQKSRRFGEIDSVNKAQMNKFLSKTKETKEAVVFFFKNKR